MRLYLSITLVQGPVGLSALFIPIFFALRAYKTLKYGELRTTSAYIITGLFLIGSFLLYVFVLDAVLRMYYGTLSLFLLGTFAVEHMLTKNR
jgi:hypothetical protein